MKTPILAAALATASLAAAGTAQAGPDAIRIGVLNDQTGLYADFGGVGSVEAARLAVEEFGGTVLGKKIEIITADHQNKPDIGLTIAREWFDVQKVDAIAEMTNSAIAIGVQNLAKERGRITLATAAGTTRLTNEDCSPTSFHWMWDTYSQATGTARAVLQGGDKSWFMLSADYAFGHQMAAELSKTVLEGGGTVAGQVKHPIGSADFSSFLLQAQASKAQVIGLANGGTDTSNAIKQAAEFGITDSGQKLVGLAVMISDVHALGLASAKGLIATDGYYWDRDEGSRELARRFEARMKRKPNMVQAGVYSAVLHYLKAMQAAGTDDGKVVAEKMREMPVDDLITKGAKVRADGRVARDMYLIQVKTPAESKGPWDYYKILRTIPAEQATMPLSESKCYLVKKS
ncbi:ABC transporter substrate-binding protein [Azospirillum agricola]|uniref:ABC transporter substrate-binding protein n=1 Tax=Azospirillum agricola TaxID=1720247 RepID=UPI000A0F0948|nr:ABC transporter substrate-binding protein [Azospirillum agricola]SMH61926.1 branched-chain amino acid transport system substrate-binding protein [Azospirillum lipoferum]